MRLTDCLEGKEAWRPTHFSIFKTLWKLLIFRNLPYYLIGDETTVYLLIRAPEPISDNEESDDDQRRHFLHLNSIAI